MASTCSSPRKRHKAQEANAIVEEKKAIQFVRTFAHVDGNWPGLVSIPLLDNASMPNRRKLRLLFDDVLSHFLTHNPHAPPSENDTQLEFDPHISLSRAFVLRFHQINSFTEDFKKNISMAQRRFSLGIDARYQILLNETKTRAFLCIPLCAPSLEPLRNLVHTTDALLTSFAQPKYHEKPIFHISIASWIPLSQTKNRSEEELQLIVNVPTNYCSKKRFFECKSDEDIDDDDSDVSFESICRAPQEEDNAGSTIASLLEGYGSESEEESRNTTSQDVSDCTRCKTMRIIISRIVANIGNKAVSVVLV